MLPDCDNVTPERDSENVTPTPPRGRGGKGRLASGSVPPGMAPIRVEPLSPMKGDILLSHKEARRLSVLENVLAGKLSVPAAAELLGLSERHIKRLKRGMQQYGAAFLAHKNRGRKPKHTIPDATRRQVVELALTRYRGASCQHMAELLAEHEGLHLSAKTISRILRAAGVPIAHTHRAPRRHRCRDRHTQEGLLVQMDASPYHWLEDRGPQASLHGAIDDATGKVLGLYFLPQEQTLGYLHVLHQILTHYGIPHSVYTDRHTLFFSPQPQQLSLEEELAGQETRLTQFGRALRQLDVRHIPARSPQAKGRVERLWGTLQERLTLELRLAGIDNYDDANRFLPDFIERFNQRFAVVPAEPIPAWRPKPSAQDLATVLAFHHVRKASAGSTISFRGQTYQLLDSHGRTLPLPARAPVTVIEDLHGSLRALYHTRLYRLQVLASPKPLAQPDKTTAAPPSKPPRSSKPAPNHPWRRPFKSPASQPARSTSAAPGG